MQDIAEGAHGSPERVRLHITPFNPELLDKILAPALKSLASDISFHTVQTFPDRGFGYVELPAMEAQKLKKKLNGSTLRGAKVRIEEAKPKRKRNSDGEEAEDADGDRKARKTERKGTKRTEEGVIAGHELEEGRRVKRGWVDDSAKSKDSKKKGKPAKRAEEGEDRLEGKKLRFKTSIPPNASPTEPKQKKGKEAKRSSKKKTVVEEFSKTTAPKGTSQAADTDRSSSIYEEGKGWIDAAGNVVEAEPESRKRKSKDKRPQLELRISAIESRETDEYQTTQPLPESSKVVEDEDTSMDVKTADSVVETEPAKETHPLEVLFKRPAFKSSDGGRPRPTPINTSFSFFDAPVAEDADMGIDMPPQTPHTKRDLEWRSIRSAAPTPDTAAIGRHFSFPFAGASDEEDDEAGVSEERDTEMADTEQPQSTTGPGDAPDKGEESAFRKWFYENRGDLNRGWKKRRRDEKKAERQRENRRLSRRLA